VPTAWSEVTTLSRRASAPLQAEILGFGLPIGNNPPLDNAASFTERTAAPAIHPGSRAFPRIARLQRYHADQRPQEGSWRAPMTLLCAWLGRHAAGALEMVPARLTRRLPSR
jgi:hypothetical protein